MALSIIDVVVGNVPLRVVSTPWYKLEQLYFGTGMNQGHSLTVLFLSSNCVSNASTNNEVVKKEKENNAYNVQYTSPTYIRILPAERTRILLPIAVVSLGYYIRECTTPRIAVHFIFEGSACLCWC
jgi:hypothetical protein